MCPVIYIYKNDNGKVIYVGRTNQSLKKRDYQHKHSKHCTTDFDKFMSKNQHLMPEVVWEGTSSETCEYMEWVYIHKYNTFHDGMNSNKGSNPFKKYFYRAMEGTLLNDLLQYGYDIDTTESVIKSLKKRNNMHKEIEERMRLFYMG